MAVEIERRYLVDAEAWRAARAGVARSEDLTQGYLATDPRCMVRVRRGSHGAWLTIKGQAHGPRKPEWEYAIPREDAGELLALCNERVIDKTRHTIVQHGFEWVVDEFHGANEGLVLAEIEVPSDADLARATESLASWIAREVTDDHRYSNLGLALHPWSTWPADEK